MKTIRHLLLILCVGFSVATVTSEAVAVAVLWYKGYLDQPRLLRILAAAYGLEPSRAPSPHAVEPLQVSHGEVMEARFLALLDVSLRETALDKASRDFLDMQSQLVAEKQRYDQRKGQFEEELLQRQSGRQNQQLTEVQQTLEQLPGKQAKDQILRMLARPATPTARPTAAAPAPRVPLQMPEVVSMIKSMPLDKRKRLIAEFKGDDARVLTDILDQIRQGVPDVPLIDATRDDLRRFIPAGLLRPDATNQETAASPVGAS